MRFKETKGKPTWMGYGVSVAFLHVAGITCLLLAIQKNPAFLGLGFLAYTLGMRHAFDVDHIAAIDNTVRKLVQHKKNPTGVGFFFSMGHSTVVCIMALITAFAAHWAQLHIPQMKEIGGMIGTYVSGFFLVMIGMVNLYIMLNMIKVFKGMRSGEYGEHKMDELLHSRGLISRFISPLLRFVNKSWHVYPIGFLFGLGFDTASEVALLAISAGAAQSVYSFTGLLALPILFAAGMSLLDTADGIFMTTAYRWALTTPLRKVYYNLTVTGLSVIAALMIGFIELSQVLSVKLRLKGAFWNWMQELDLGSLGYILVGLFVLSWACSYAAWRFFRIEERFGS
jgi:nickel/cobalt transporter (NiCoT) family protein